MIPDLDDTFTAEDWMRGPGDEKEVERVAKRLGLKDTALSTVLQMAATLTDDIDENPVNDDEDLDRRNTAGTLLWFAASSGSRRAAFLLADWIRHETKTSAMREATAVYFEQLANEWDMYGEGDLGKGLHPLVVSITNDAQRLRPPRPADDDAQAALAVETHKVPEGHVVVKSIGDARSPEGIALSKRYGHIIGVPLPRRARMPEEGEIAAALDKEWPWAKHIAKHIESMLSIQRSVNAAPALTPMLFVGPPGSGKTALAAKVAELFGLPSTIVPAGGASDSAGLSAITRGWSSSRPCGPVMAAAEHHCCDPAIIVDELDKTAGPGSRNGSASGVLLGILGNPTSFHDACLLSNVDLSQMLFMATANDLGTIPGAVLDRFSVFVLGRPQPDHFDVVLGAVRERAARKLGVHREFLPALDVDEYAALKDHFVKSDCSLREVARAFDFVLSEAVQRVNATPMMAH